MVEDKTIVFQKGSVEDLREKLQQCCNDKNFVGRYNQGVARFICQKYCWMMWWIRQLKFTEAWKDIRADKSKEDKKRWMGMPVLCQKA